MESPIPFRYCASRFLTAIAQAAYAHRMNIETIISQHMAAIGGKGGRAKTAAKRKASRANAAKATEARRQNAAERRDKSAPNQAKG